MTPQLESERRQFITLFESELQSYLTEALFKNNSLIPAINESMQYSLKSNGKRFRPFLSYLLFKTGSSDFSKMKSWALATEFIHTYSLIHDDLPCMDNDDYRRGVPTNHKVYGEDMALLAGDSLISEAFKVIADDPLLAPAVKVKLVQLLAKKIGPAGMVGGQVLDMKATSSVQLSDLQTIHILKTGCLIQAAAIGAAEILEMKSEHIDRIAEFSLHLGLAFQIKDDLLDYTSAEQDFKSYVPFLGLEGTQKELELHSQKAVESLKFLDSKQSALLVDLIQYNLSRTS